MIANLLQMLKHKSKTPAQHLRAVLQNTTGVADFRGAVAALSTGEQVDENYFVVGGVGSVLGGAVDATVSGTDALLGGLGSIIGVGKNTEEAGGQPLM